MRRNSAKYWHFLPSCEYTGGSLCSIIAKVTDDPKAKTWREMRLLTTRQWHGNGSNTRWQGAEQTKSVILQERPVRCKQLKPNGYRPTYQDKRTSAQTLTSSDFHQQFGTQAHVSLYTRQRAVTIKPTHERAKAMIMPLLLPVTSTFPLEGRLDARLDPRLDGRLFPSPFSLEKVGLLASAVEPPTREIENPSLRKAVLVRSSTKRFLSVSSDSISPLKQSNL